MNILDANHSHSRTGGSSFNRSNRLYRAIWTITWTLLGAWTPRPCVTWRRSILRLFGAQLHSTAIVNRGVKIWSPKNLRMDEFSCLGPDVICYSMDKIHLKPYSLVSQGGHLCAGSHDISRENFQLIVAPIEVGQYAWVAAEAFIGPGVSVGEGAVLGARGVAFSNLDPFWVYIGNPARKVKHRSICPQGKQEG